LFEACSWGVFLDFAVCLAFVSRFCLEFRLALRLHRQQIVGGIRRHSRL